MANFTALLDANVLYPARLRDLLIRLALTKRFRARWTAQIHDEWTRNLLVNRKDLHVDQLERTRALMDQAVPDVLVTGYEGLILGLNLPDPDDRHVLAAAIHCNAGVIVTLNLRDFPAETLAAYGIEAQHPDTFIAHLADLSLPQVAAVVRAARLSLRNPPVSVDELLDGYLALGLADTVTVLSPMRELL